VEEKQHIRRIWVDSLHRWGVQDFVALILDAVEPLAPVFAQILFVTQPLVRPFIADEKINALVDILDNPKEVQTFLDMLQEK